MCALGGGVRWPSSLPRCAPVKALLLLCAVIGRCLRAPAPTCADAAVWPVAAAALPGVPTGTCAQWLQLVPARHSPWCAAGLCILCTCRVLQEAACSGSRGSVPGCSWLGILPCHLQLSSGELTRQLENALLVAGPGVPAIPEAEMVSLLGDLLFASSHPGGLLAASLPCWLWLGL